MQAIAFVAAILMLYSACNKDDAKPNAPLTFDTKSMVLPHGVEIDSTTITVTEDLSEQQIKALFEQGRVVDADAQGGTGSIKSIRIIGSRVMITLQGTNGATGETEEKSIEYTIKVKKLTDSFPKTLTGNATDRITAGDSTFIKSIFEREFVLSNGQKVKASEITIKKTDDAVATTVKDKNHSINMP